MTPPTTPAWLLELYPPSRLGLLDHLRDLVDPAMLQEISQADYGEDAAAHLAALETICRDDDLARPFYACGLLILTLLQRTGITEPQAAALCDWVIAEEAAARRQNEHFIDSDLWLFGLGVIHLHDKWRSYLRRAREAAPFPPVAALADRLL